MKDVERLNAPATYAIQVAGKLSPAWSEWFDGMVVTVTGEEKGDPHTLLVGPVKDQSALRGLLSRIWNLNLTVIFVQRLDRTSEGSHHIHDLDNSLGGKHGDQNDGNE